MYLVIRRRLISVLLAAAIFFAAAAAVFEPSGRAHAAGEYMTWLQMDEKWGETPMGSTTIARSGCLITSMSIMAMHTDSIDEKALENLEISSIDEFDPGVLANAYTKNDGFTKGGGIASWGTISKILPKITFVGDSHLKGSTQHEIAQEIRDLMASGLHIILNVNGHHWVYIEGIHGDDIYMMDPGSNERLVYDYYELEGQNEYWALQCAKAPVIEPEVLVVKDPLNYTEPSEYYNPFSSPVPIYVDSPVEVEYDSGSAIAFELKKGWVVTIDAFYGSYGRLVTSSGEVIGWADAEKLSPWHSYNYYEEASGDINGDGVVDDTDVAALNEAIKTEKLLPEGVSPLTEAERRAADMNWDGVIDNNDVEKLLRKIYFPTEPETEPVTEYVTEPVEDESEDITEE